MNLKNKKMNPEILNDVNIDTVLNALLIHLIVTTIIISILTSGPSKPKDKNEEED